MATNSGGVSVQATPRTRPDKPKRLGAENSSEHQRKVVYEALLKRLIEIPTFLQESEAQTEQQVADSIKLPALKWLVRDAIIDLCRQQCLVRTPGGVCRAMLSLEQLPSLFALRIQLELSAVAGLRRLPADSHASIAAGLYPLVERQRKLSDDPEFFEWYQCGVEFHVELLKQARLGDYVDFLKPVFHRLRISSAMEPESPGEEREIVVREHEELLLKLESLSDIDSKNKESMEATVEKHVLLSLTRATKAHYQRASRISAGDSRNLAERLWRQVLVIGRVPSLIAAEQ